MKLLLLFTLGLLTLLFFACGDEEEVAPPPTATLTATAVPSATSAATPTAAPTPTTAWKTFTNTKYGYSLEYPADWLVNPDLSGIDPSTSNYVAFYNHEPPETGSGQPLPPDKLKIEVWVHQNQKDLPLDQWVQEFNASSPSQPSIKSSEQITVAGRYGIRQIVSAEGFEFYAAYFGAGHNVYVISGPQTNTALLDQYEQFLSSFQVTP